jgi:hypothetical protein
MATEGNGRFTRVTLVVPDGVARVKFVFPRQPQPGNFAGRTDLIRGRRRGDQATQQSGGCEPGRPDAPTGPETSLTRAAERDPSMNGGIGGGNNDLRGRVWSDQVDAVDGQTWCPGTYHLSATIVNREPARPFGTATFTVKP